MLTAVQLLDASIRRGVDIGEWAAQVMTRYPQVLHNVRVERRIEDLDAKLADDVAAEQLRLGGEGRILIRASGTEPLVRVMVEAADHGVAEATAARLGAAVEVLAASSS